MKELRFRLFIILGAIALSLYLLHYTYADYQNNKKVDKIRQHVIDSVRSANPKLATDKVQALGESVADSVRVNNPSYAKDRAKRLKLGLDLQGGMYMVMEVNTTEMLRKLAKDPDANFRQALQAAESEVKANDADIVSVLARNIQSKGIRLSRYFGTIRESDNEIISNLKKQADDAVSRAMEIIRNRVDQYGVSEPSIQKQGSRRIIVELPGVAKEEEAKHLLQGSALLEFKLLKDPNFTVQVMQKVDGALAGTDIADSTSDSTKAASKTAAVKKDSSKKNNKELSKEEFAKQHPFFAIAMIPPQATSAEAYVKESDRGRLDMMLNRPEVKKVMPDNVEFLYSAKPITGQDGVKYRLLYMVNKTPELTGGTITEARANIDPQTSGAEVSMQMNSEGAREWARITGSNVGKRIAIVLDNFVYSAPTVQNKIPNGSSQITGMKDMDEAKLIEIVLKAGALPAPVEIMEERIVGPSLGTDSVYQGLNSALIGYLFIAIFMIVYYQKSGAIADLGLFITILLIMGVLAGFSATLTLPGIAGIVLTMGMAVDANVLIFERIREEMATGKTLKAAVDSGFANSYSAIIDSNITTFITGLILYQFGGSGPVQGFALTLMIGIVISMFSALVVARVVYDYMIAKGAKISIG
ncbi:MAG: protein translocase subunit SecD [Ignavibacteria bacterium]|jgi:preprotein translocase subunit SecD|nr:protein translocase subunit SecD [Ignavibacteria bacterium]MCU7504837.1 protein translocase subunit SecD [Ignavibacteria bacterium]MCU7517723.1 protein translocase subunit SecD [Ignavibacteria bacterium]